VSVDPTTDRFVPFRGSLRAGLAQKHVLVFVTVHAEGRPTAVYRLDLDKSELAEDALPGGAVAIVEAGGFVFVAGTDGRIHRGKDAGGALAPLGEALDPAPTALAILSEGRLAAISGASIVILDRDTGKRLQTLPLADPGTALAADASGTWLVAGTARGTLAVFDGEERRELIGAESKKIHEGAVTALLFDPDELRVYSAGSDNRLLLTHIRGELEPEDRAGGAAHDAPPQALCLGVDDKLYTGGRDGTIKTWTRGAQKKRPSTLKDGVGNAVALARVEWKGRAHLALLAEDATVRLFPLDAGGKVNDRALIVRDAYALAEHAFEEKAPERREAALRTAAAYDDARAIEILAARASNDPDHGLRALATSLLGATKNPRAVKPLEALLHAGEAQVRLAALAGLRAHEGEASLRPLELALGAQKRDVGAAAVSALTALATGDDQAMARLVQALDEDPFEVRQAALAGLEELFPTPSAEAEIIALRSVRPDLRRLALVRCFQRKLLGAPEVLAALRRHEGDADADVRRAAFLVSLMTRPALAEALGARDRDLGQKLGELATIGQKVAPASGETKAEAKAETKAEAKAPRAKKAKADAKAEAKADAPTLAESDLRPLLEAMASRALDTCLAGARGLASLQDERAFGTLLQLTNEKQPSARVEACRALADLGDARGLPRLRQLLRDAASEVRDAAFSSLAKLEEKTPLRAAEAGLLAPADDVRGRALQLLVRLLKKDVPKDLASPGAALLSRALDDSAATVRGEAFKAALAIEIGGGGAGTLRFALRSIHAEVRREVLNEVMGRIQEPWAAALLLELLADPDAGVRGDAFEFSQKRGKGRAVEPLAAALAGQYADLKLKTIEVLAKRRVDGARGLLEKALADADEQVRVAAVNALLADEASAAMESPHADVRVRAAAARAILGDAKALAPLLGLVTESEPALAETREAWIDRVARALRALGELGAPEAAGPAFALLAHKDKRIAGAAVDALGGVARPFGDLAPLKAALAHPDADLKRDAALGLAGAEDPAGLPLLRGLVAAAGSLAMRGLGASIALGERAADLFMAYLDHADERVRGRALLAMMLIESSEQDGAPDRCLAALSSAHPRVRLTAARALESFAEPGAFARFVLELLNDRGDDRAPFTIPAETARILAEALTHGDPQLKVRTARLLDALDEEKQERFEHAFGIYRQRFAGAIDALLAAAKKRKPATPEYAEAELRRVVTGAYAGLSRQIGGALEVRVRQTALARLAEMARAAPSEKEGILPLLLLGLGDPVATVRKLAFDTLVAYGMPVAELGAEALAVGQRDVGAMGLALLSSGGDPAERRKVLEQIFLGNTDGLQDEAGKLLLEIAAPAVVHEQGLLARSPSVRDRSVAGLAELWEAKDGGDRVKTALRGALASRYGHVRENAAVELAGKKDPAAFAALVPLLDGEAQRRAIQALGRLGDPRGPEAFMNRIDRDPAGTALTSELLAAAAAFRLPSSAPRLLGYLDDRKKVRAASSALLTVSGYDQPILDPECEGAGPAIVAGKEHPRHEAVLAQLLDAAYRLGDTALLGQLLPAARWAPGRVIDAALTPLATFAKDDVRDRAVEALGFRLRKRGGAAEPLVAALSHPNPTTQLLAAEGLALAGRADGIRVLLTGIDLLPELDERRRAVRALGKLADPRGLDPLLRLVNEEGHALQDEAAEALGHLKATPKGPQIEAILLRHARAEGSVARQALSGLRWFDSLEGWRLLRERAKDDDAQIRLHVVEILGHDRDPASRLVLVDRLQNEDDYRVAKQAAESLRRLDGDDSLEPDYAIAAAAYAGLEERTVERLRERGDAARILDLLPKIVDDREEELVRPLTAALLARAPLPLDAAAARLESVHERVAQVAAQILARGGAMAAKAHGKAVIAAARKAAEGWAKARADVDRGEDNLDAHTERYRRLVDALGKLAVGADEVAAAASLGGDDAGARPVRIAALLALASGFAGAPGLDALAAAAVGNDGRERELAAGALGKLAPDRATALAPRLLDDRDSLRGLLVGHAQAALPALRAAALKTHTQGIALPLLIEHRDVDGLAAALADRALPEAARFGAIEALARIATEAAFAPILAVARADAEDDELRKAAWRALRRGRRYQKKAAQAREVSR
jgi:ParB family chromosome partitioning protein